MDVEELVKEILREMFGDQLKPDTLNAIAKSVAQDNDFVKQLQQLAKTSKEIQKMLTSVIKKELESMKGKILDEIHRDKLKEQKLREERIQQFKDQLAVLYEMWLSMIRKKQLEDQQLQAEKIEKMFQEVNTILDNNGEAFKSVQREVSKISPQEADTYQSYMNNQ